MVFISVKLLVFMISKAVKHYCLKEKMTKLPTNQQPTQALIWQEINTKRNIRWKGLLVTSSPLESLKERWLILCCIYCTLYSIHFTVGFASACGCCDHDFWCRFPWFNNFSACKVCRDLNTGFTPGKHLIFPCRQKTSVGSWKYLWRYNLLRDKKFKKRRFFSP